MADFDPKAPYNDLPDLPPPLELIETTELLKLLCTDYKPKNAPIIQVGAGQFLKHY